MRLFPTGAHVGGRQHCARRFSSVGVRDVLHARCAVSGLPAHGGKRLHGRSNCRTLPWASANSLRQLHPRLSGRGGPLRCCSSCFRTYRTLLSEPPSAPPSLRPAGRKDLSHSRFGRIVGVLLPAETRLPALPDAQARQFGKTESYHSNAVGDGRDARPIQGRSALMPEFVAPQDGIGRTAKSQRLVGRCPSPSGLPRGWRSLRLRVPRRWAILFACHPVAKMITDAGDDFILALANQSRLWTLYDFIDGADVPPATSSPPPQYERDRSVIGSDRGGPAARRQGRDIGQLDWLRDRRRHRAQVKYSMAWVTSQFPSQGQCRRESPAARRDGRSRTRASTC